MQRNANGVENMEKQVTTKNIGMGMSSAIMEMGGVRKVATMQKHGNGWMIVGNDGKRQVFTGYGKQAAAEMYFAG
jgi:hypothetical protein